MESTCQHHWQTVYQTKDTSKVGWFQAYPRVSLELISKSRIPFHSSIIDVGGGDSLFVDGLLDLRYNKLTVLDISASALEKAQHRLGKTADLVSWEVSDVLEFEPEEKFDLWHDRAVFHFLTDSNDQQRYLYLVRRSINSGVYLLIMTFSKSGPKTCSGLTVKQYDPADLEEFFGKDFELTESLNYDHFTPSGATQNYTVCLFKKR